MPAPTVALATCSAFPDLDDDDRLLLPALGGVGIEARAEVWDDPAVDWARYALVVIRSTWDYADRRLEFLGWASRLRRVLNTHDVLVWNTDKSYLRELAAAGIAVVPTTWHEPRTAPTFVDIPGGEVVVKPAVSAGARNTARYGPGEAERARAHVRRLLDQGRTVMVQPYVGAVDEHGETAVIHIDGSYSHSIRKGPILAPGSGDGVGENSRLFVPEQTAPIEPVADERALAEATLAALPWPPGSLLYARVDVVRDALGAPLVLEVELSEPSLFFAHADGAAARLAGAVARRLVATTSG